jgi:hypothetical protein
MQKATSGLIHEWKDEQNEGRVRNIRTRAAKPTVKALSFTAQKSQRPVLVFLGYSQSIEARHLHWRWRVTIPYFC